MKNELKHGERRRQRQDENRRSFAKKLRKNCPEISQEKQKNQMWTRDLGSEKSTFSADEHSIGRIHRICRRLRVR